MLCSKRLEYIDINLIFPTTAEGTDLTLI